MKTMKAARMHKVGSAMQLEDIPIPEPRGQDVLVRVRRAESSRTSTTSSPTGRPGFPNSRCRLCRIFGLDPAGEIAVGSRCMTGRSATAST